jgi:hypothetical protein
MAAVAVTIPRVIVNPDGYDLPEDPVLVHNRGANHVDLLGWKLADTGVFFESLRMSRERANPRRPGSAAPR